VVKGTLLSLSHRGPEAATGVIIGKLANRKEAASRGVKAKGFQHLITVAPIPCDPPFLLARHRSRVMPGVMQGMGLGYLLVSP